MTRCKVEVSGQAIAACGPPPTTVKIYSFCQHNEGAVSPIKGTPEGIAKYMMGVPIEGSGQEIDPSLLDDEGFYRPPSSSKPSSSTS